MHPKLSLRSTFFLHFGGDLFMPRTHSLFPLHFCCWRVKFAFAFSSFEVHFYLFLDLVLVVFSFFLVNWRVSVGVTTFGSLSVLGERREKLFPRFLLLLLFLFFFPLFSSFFFFLAFSTSPSVRSVGVGFTKYHINYSFDNCFIMKPNFHR